MLKTLFFPFYCKPLGFNEVYPPKTPDGIIPDIMEPYHFTKDVIVKGYGISISTFPSTHVQVIISKKFLKWKEVVPPTKAIERNTIIGGLNSHDADNIAVMFPQKDFILVSKTDKDAIHLKVWSHNMEWKSLFGFKRDFHLWVIIYYEELE